MDSGVVSLRLTLEPYHLELRRTPLQRSLESDFHQTRRATVLVNQNLLHRYYQSCCCCCYRYYQSRCCCCFNTPLLYLHCTLTTPSPHLHTYTSTRTHTYTHTHTCIYTYIHTRTQRGIFHLFLCLHHRLKPLRRLQPGQRSQRS